MSGSLNNEEQEGNNDAEQKAAHEEGEHGTEQLPKLQRHHQSDTLRRGVGGLYASFVALVINFGILAYYIKHDTAAEVVFFISIPLILIIPIVAFLGWLPLFRLASATKTTTRRHLLLRFSSSRASRLINFGIAIDSLAYGIVRVLPRDPAWGVVIIAFNILALAVNITYEIVRPLQREIDALWKQNDRIVAAFLANSDLHKRTWETIGAIGDDHLQTIEYLGAALKLISATNDTIIEESKARTAADDATMKALCATNEALRIVAGVPDPDKPDTSPKDDKAPGDD